MNNRHIEKILAACAIKQASIIEQVDAESKKINITPDFQNRIGFMITTLKVKRRRKKYVYRILASFFLILSVTFGACMTVNASRSNILHFFDRYFSFNSGKTEVWDVSHNDQIISNVHDVYLPTWVPNGFKATESSQGNSSCTITYKSGNKVLRLTQESMPKTLFSDSDLVNLEKITVNKQTYYFGERSSTHKLLWRTNSNTFLVVSNISKEEIIQFASGLVYKEG